MLLIFKCLVSIPKTVFFNFRIFKFTTAIKLPVLVAYNVKLKGIYHGCIEIKDKVRPFMIKFGIAGSDAILGRKGLIRLNKTKLVFEGKAHFSEGIRIFANETVISFGNNINFNKNNFISSDYNMKFGKDVLVGWNVNIRDSDGHEISYEGKKEKSNEVIIGNHVWIGSETDILKGTNIEDESVVAYNSCICGLNAPKKTLVGGYPAKVIKENIEWKK